MRQRKSEEVTATLGQEIIKVVMNFNGKMEATPEPLGANAVAIQELEVAEAALPDLTADHEFEIKCFSVFLSKISEKRSY